VGVWLLLQCEAGRNTGKLGSLHTCTHTTHTRVDVYNGREKGGLPTGSTRQRTSPPSHVTSASRPIGSPIGSCSRATPQFPSLLDKLECVCVCVCVSIQHMRDYGRTECTALSWSSSSLLRRAGLWCIARWFISFFYYFLRDSL
jgi:hypothetical protein